MKQPIALSPKLDSDLQVLIGNWSERVYGKRADAMELDLLATSVERMFASSPAPVWASEPQPTTELQDRLRILLNSVSSENGSNTPDFILADYLLNCLQAFNQACNAREKWYGRSAHPILASGAIAKVIP